MCLRTLATTAAAAAAVLCGVLAPPAGAPPQAGQVPHGPDGSRACSPYLSVAGYSDALDETTVDGAPSAASPVSRPTGTAPSPESPAVPCCTP